MAAAEGQDKGDDSKKQGTRLDICLVVPVIIFILMLLSKGSCIIKIMRFKSCDIPPGKLAQRAMFCRYSFLIFNFLYFLNGGLWNQEISGNTGRIFTYFSGLVKQLKGLKNPAFI